MNEQLERVEEKATVEVGATVVEPSVHTEEKKFG